ncbi:MAG: VWA domain-containing protein [Elusimicrobiota bacterium]
MIPVILGHSVYKVRKMEEIIIVCALFFLLLSLAGPQFGTKMVSIKRKTLDVIIAIDCSKSMLARDFQPSRISKAKEMLSILIERLKDNRIGIIAFAGTAFTQCPLTFDFKSAKMLLDLINTDLIPLPGTSIGSAIRLATKSFGTEGGTSKVLVLLTDGEDHKSDPLGATDDARQSGITIFTVGIGTPQGEPIPEGESGGSVTEYKKNKKGQVITSKLDEQLLHDIAEKSRGRYYPMSYSDVGIAEQIFADISTLEKKEVKSGVYGVYEQRFQIPLLIALLLLIVNTLLKIDFSFFLKIIKQITVSVLLTIVSYSILEAGARTEIKKGNKHYNKGQYEEALERYTEAGIKAPGSPVVHFNSGDALYKIENHQDALKEFNTALGKTRDRKLQSKIYYNIGNSFFKQGKPDDALKNYKKSLDLNPKDEDAKYNIALILQRKNLAEKKHQKNGKDKKDKEKQEKNKEGSRKSEVGSSEKGEKKEEKKKYMSKEDVERLLQMAGEQEKDAMKKKSKTAMPQLPAVEEDW